MPDRAGQPVRRGWWPWSRRSARGRRTAKLQAPSRADRLRTLAEHPSFVPLVLVAGVMLVSATLIIGLSRQRLLMAEGRIADETRLARVDFEVLDEVATERARAVKRASTPRVYGADEAVWRELQASLVAMPAALAATEKIDQVAPELRAAFGLTQEQLDGVRAETGSWAGAGADPGGAESAAWAERVQRLVKLLGERPILSSEEYQLALNDPAPLLELHQPGGAQRLQAKEAALNAKGDFKPVAEDLVREAGFSGVIARVVAQRLLAQPKPTYIFDREQTESKRDEQARAVPPVKVKHQVGDVLARRGERIKAEQIDVLRREAREHRAGQDRVTRFTQWGGVALIAATIVVGLTLYVRLFFPGLSGATRRMAALAGLTLLGPAVACWSSVWHPEWLWLTASAPIVFVAMVTTVAFQARLGLASGVAQVGLVGSALGLGAGFGVACLAAMAVSAWKLKEIRSRSDVVRAAVLVGVTLAIGVGAAALVARPDAPGITNEVLWDALSAGLGGFFAGALLLVMLPTVERVFNVTTGMTLSEWRDPKQPLLRRLQQQAPGTFNHSHTVATLAEAAAEAVGADGLHVYVGALYHDIGKMNKPDYFVENQVRGFNRHAKLSPAMSLLVIVGHVKDGIELAREFKLPRSLHGYIETHHGTTLVEYFFDQARRQAEDEELDDIPEEVEYRYPGPRPRTKEQAILMISDGVESATRSMPEPTPARIATLVHQMATKRLMDGQFDECGITLAELRRIEEAITRTLASIYHGRIAYPTSAGDSATRDSSATSTTAREGERRA